MPTAAVSLRELYDDSGGLVRSVATEQRLLAFGAIASNRSACGLRILYPEPKPLA